jgi:hypothetical protein
MNQTYNPRQPVSRVYVMCRSYMNHHFQPVAGEFLRGISSLIQGELREEIDVCQSARSVKGAFDPYKPVLDIEPRSVSVPVSLFLQPLTSGSRIWVRLLSCKPKHLAATV